MSDHENKSGQSWFKAATLCVAFACAAGVTTVADAQPSAGKPIVAAVDAKTAHRKLLEREIDLTSALATVCGSSQQAVDQYRSDAKAKLDEKATGNPDDMRRTGYANRKLEQNLMQMNKALAVSRA